MKSVIRIFAFTLALTSIAALAQTKDVTVKDSPASQTLAQLAKDHTADLAAFNVKLQQANSALDQSNKTLTDQMVSIRKSVEDDLGKDKKYKGRLEAIANLQKKFSGNKDAANAAFQRDAGAIQAKVQMEAAQIDGLIPVVRKENGLPDNAVFDQATGKWSVPEVKK